MTTMYVFQDEMSQLNALNTNAQNNIEGLSLLNYFKTRDLTFIANDINAYNERINRNIKFIEISPKAWNKLWVMAVAEIIGIDHFQMLRYLLGAEDLSPLHAQPPIQLIPSKRIIHERITKGIPTNIVATELKESTQFKAELIKPNGTVQVQDIALSDETGYGVISLTLPNDYVGAKVKVRVSQTIASVADYPNHLLEDVIAVSEQFVTVQ